MAGRQQEPYPLPFTGAFWGRVIDLRYQSQKAWARGLEAEKFIRSLQDARYADIFNDTRGYYAARDLFRGFGLPKKVGRPRGSRARTGGRPPIDPELAERAAQMKAEAKTEKEIAISLLPGMDPTSAKARGKVRRLVERGQA